MPILPPLNTMAQFCQDVAHVMNKTAYLPYREPTCDIATFDQQRGTPDVSDPLLTAHKMARFYLVGAGDLVFSIGQLLSLEVPMVISPAVLARTVAEYCGRVKYLSDTEDTPEKRISKVLNVFHEGFQQAGVNSPAADPGLVEMARGFDRWRGKNPLPRAPKPNYDKLIAALSPEMGIKEYNSLSQLVHADALAVTGAFLSTVTGHPRRIEDSWRHALFATQCGLLAAAQVCFLREGDREPIQSCLTTFYAAAETYNDYLAELAAEQGIATPTSPAG
ncbi:hypothetical protein ACFWBG_24565 [Nocardia salmonicida]|uniref:hypothetical protein n=1 Tax=Nocardia salmonicida TaxID=53431 RepID=UPI00366C0E6D